MEHLILMDANLGWSGSCSLGRLDLRVAGATNSDVWVHADHREAMLACWTALTSTLHPACLYVHALRAGHGPPTSTQASAFVVDV